jgi:hypothetical protein
MVLRTEENVANSPDELPKWIKVLYPVLHAEHWRIHDKKPEPKDQRLTFL